MAATALQTQISFTHTAQHFNSNTATATGTTSVAIRESQEFGGKRIGGKGGARIKVAVRIRPLLDSELNAGHSSTCIRVTEANHTIA